MESDSVGESIPLDAVDGANEQKLYKEVIIYETNELTVKNTDTSVCRDEKEELQHLEKEDKADVSSPSHTMSAETSSAVQLVDNGASKSSSLIQNGVMRSDSDKQVYVPLSARTKRRSTSKDSDDETPRLKRADTVLQVDRLQHAKVIAEEAMRKRKIFTIIGPYRKVREIMRNRGWVELFHNLQGGVEAVQKKTLTSRKDDDDSDDDDDDGDDDDDDDCEGSKIPPWEEEGGLYGLMSRLVRNATPTLIWSLRKGQVDFRFLKKDQIVNHHAKAHHLTTKVGLCKILRDMHWHGQRDADQFFPRCYILSAFDEKQSFIDDFRLTACMSLLKVVAYGDDNEPETEIATENTQETSPRSKKAGKRSLPKIKYTRPRSQAIVPPTAITFAVAHCEQFLREKCHDDIDANSEYGGTSDASWEQFLTWYYEVAQKGAHIEGAARLKDECITLCKQLKAVYPQFDLDGIRNMWIVKPGAKSRGRGIMFYERLNEVLKLVTNNVTMGESKYVIQKYIERPLLIHKTKFDVRQWFVVTDWNPLTVWWYKDCYIRFCSQKFTLEDFNESVHLSNNSIQYKYENGPRSPLLPDNNMWDCDQFQIWLKRCGHKNVWENVISPGMKEAVVSALLCSQNLINIRKNCFELYGADFMFTDDYIPWLLEINCSPTMAASTSVTARLTTRVLEDTMKVVLDRRYDKSRDVGAYELIFKQPLVSVPPYNGIDLTVAGEQIRRKNASGPTFNTPPSNTSANSEATKSFSRPTKSNEPPRFKATKLKETVTDSMNISAGVLANTPAEKKEALITLKRRNLSARTFRTPVTSTYAQDRSPLIERTRNANEPRKRFSVDVKEKSVESPIVLCPTRVEIVDFQQGHVSSISSSRHSKQQQKQRSSFQQTSPHRLTCEYSKEENESDITDSSYCGNKTLSKSKAVQPVRLYSFNEGARAGSANTKGFYRAGFHAYTPVAKKCEPLPTSRWHRNAPPPPQHLQPIPGTSGFLDLRTLLPVETGPTCAPSRREATVLASTHQERHHGVNVSAMIPQTNQGASSNLMRKFEEAVRKQRTRIPPTMQTIGDRRSTNDFRLNSRPTVSYSNVSVCDPHSSVAF